MWSLRKEGACAQQLLVQAGRARRRQMGAERRATKEMVNADANNNSNVHRPSVMGSVTTAIRQATRRKTTERGLHAKRVN